MEKDNVVKMRITVSRGSTISGIFKTIVLGPRTLIRTLQLVRARQVGVITFHYPSIDALGAAILKLSGLYKGDLILSFHGSDVKPARNLVEQILWRIIFSASDRITACSIALAVQMTKAFHLQLERISVVYNGVDTDTFSPLAIETSRAPDRSDRSAYVVSCGSFIELKGHRYLVEGFARIASRYPRMELVIIGTDGPQRQVLLNLARQLGIGNRVQCEIDLKQEAVASLLAGAVVCVQPSLSESFGLAVIEAAACGTPVAASLVGGHGEIITDGENGILFPPADAEAIASALERLLSDPSFASGLAIKLRQQILERFTWERCADEFLTGTLKRNV
jgi:glycosyltransferase involved in cell wall biosynthesis